MKDNDREIWVDESRYYLDENDVICIVPIGDFDDEKAVRGAEAGLKLMNMVEGKASVLIDLNNSGKSSSAARKIWKKMNDHEKTYKVAFFGLHPVARVTASFIMGVSRNKNMRFFKIKEEARAWLRK